MPRLPKDTELLLMATFADVMRAVRRNAAKRGSRLTVLSQKLKRAFPDDLFFRMFDMMADALGRQTDEVLLLVGSHGGVKGTVRNVNDGAMAWLTAFHGPMQGRRVSLNVVQEVEETAADFLLESHHVAEARVARFYANELRAYWKPGTTVPDADLMITIAIPSGLHRGARYAPIEAKSPRLKGLRQVLPSRQYNLTDELIKAFPDSRLQTLPFPTYLRELAQFYKTQLPDLYPEVTLPNGQKGGILAALKRISADTGVPVTWP